jgi:hypothetical protein
MKRTSEDMKKRCSSRKRPVQVYAEREDAVGEVQSPPQPGAFLIQLTHTVIQVHCTTCEQSRTNFKSICNEGSSVKDA